MSTTGQHDYSGAVERLVLVHNGQPLPALTRLRLAARTSDLACAWRRARALDRLATLNESKKEHR